MFILKRVRPQKHNEKSKFVRSTEEMRNDNTKQVKQFPDNINIFPKSD